MNRFDTDRRTPVPAYPSSTIIVLRDCGGGPEVLMIRRSEKLKFAPGAYVFPGGAVDDEDKVAGAAALPDMEDAAHRIAAVRELEEETALVLELDEARNMVLFAHWITPPESPKRFDTLFYLARAPQDEACHTLQHDGTETEEAIWISPQAVLEGEREGRIPLMFPTRLNLMWLAAGGSIEDIFAAARRRNVIPVMPRSEIRDGDLWFTIPKEAGYPVSEVHRNHVFELMGQRPDYEPGSD